MTIKSLNRLKQLHMLILVMEEKNLVAKCNIQTNIQYLFKPNILLMRLKEN